MLYGMTRKDYEELFSEPWDGQYPKSTNAAIEELRLRGLDADKSRLDYLMRKGEIEAVVKKGRNCKWTKESVDGAAEVLDRAKAYTKAAAAWAARHVLYAQYVRAFNEAKRHLLHVEPDMQILTVHPYGYGVGRKGGPGSLPGYEGAPYNLVLYHVDEKYLVRLAKSLRKFGHPVGEAVEKCVKQLRDQRDVNRAILDEDNKVEKAAAAAKPRVRKKVGRAVGPAKRRAVKPAKGAKAAAKRKRK